MVTETPLYPVPAARPIPFTIPTSETPAWCGECLALGYDTERQPAPRRTGRLVCPRFPWHRQKEVS